VKEKTKTKDKERKRKENVNKQAEEQLIEQNKPFLGKKRESFLNKSIRFANK